MIKEHYTPEPRKPRLIWNGREKRKVAEPLPSQVTEIVFPQHARVKDLSAWQEVRREQAEQARLPGMRPPSQLGFGANGSGAVLPPNRLIWTNDNLTALTALLHGDDQHEPLEGKVDLVYIDPPFAVQSDFRIEIEIADGATDEKLPTLIEELAYTDTWKNGLDSYLSMMRDRLDFLGRLLSPKGSIYVHCDQHASHYIKLILDEIFGYDRFISEIIWKRTSAHSSAKRYGPVHDTIFVYSKSGDYVWNQHFQSYSEEYLDQFYAHRDPDGRRWRRSDLTGAGVRRGATGEPWRGVAVTPKGRHWFVPPSELDKLDAEGKIHWPAKVGGMPMLKRYVDEQPGVPLQDVWSDIGPMHNLSQERSGFPTQKPLSLLQRIIEASTNPGDLVLDAFAGSGTTAVAAETMKDADGKPAPRRWIAIDCGKFAIHITRKRLIEVGAQPFAVENVGFYARGREWRDLWACQS